MIRKPVRLIMLVFLFAATRYLNAQYSLTGSTTQTIEFSSFTGVGLTPGAATTGTLDSDQWGVDFDNDGDMDSDFGDSNTAGDFTNGGTLEAGTGAEGELNAYSVGGLTGLGIGLEKNNGEVESNSIILKVVNNTGGIITDLGIEYDVYYLVSNNKPVAMDFEHGSDNITYTSPGGSFDFDETANAGVFTAGTSPSGTISSLSIGAGEVYYLKWEFESTNNGGNGALAISQIEITPTFVTPASTSTIAVDDAISSATIASTVTSSAGQAVFGFDFSDGNGTTDTYATAISDLIITEGSSDQISDWSDVIASAQLSDGTNTQSTTDIGTNTITFSSINTSTLGAVTEGGDKTYTLSIWFDTDISESIDNQTLQFEALASNFTFFGASTGMLSTEVETSDAADNMITVNADRWSFSNVPSSVGTGVEFSLDVQATDMNGNIDVDETSTFDLSSSPGGVASTSPGLSTVALTSGAASYSDLTFSSDGTYTLTASGGALLDGTSSSIISAVAYRSFQTGDWNDTDTWEVFTGGAWVNPSLATPDDVDGPITIQNTHTVSFNAAISVDQLTIESGATLTINENLTLSDQSGENDIVVEGTMTVNNTGSNWGGAAGTVEVASGGLVSTGQQGEVNDLAGAGSSTIFIYQDGSTFEYTGTNLPELTYFPDVSASEIPTFRITANQGNLNNMESMVVNGIFETDGTVTFSNSNNMTFRNGFTGTADFTYNSTGLTIPGTTVYFGGTGTVDLNGSANTFASGTTVIMSSDKQVEDGDFTFSSGSTFQTTDYSLNDGGTDNTTIAFEAGSTIQALGVNGLSNGTDGVINVNAQTINAGTLYEFNGTAAQTTNFSSVGVTTVGGLTINNSNGLTLYNGVGSTDESITINGGTLTLTDGNFITSSTSALTITSSTTISGGSSSSFIDGPITVSSFSASRELPVGDGSDYRRVILDPVNSSTMTIENVTGTPTDETNLFGFNDLLETRYWSISRSSGTGDVSLTLYIDEVDDAFTVDSDIVVATYTDASGSFRWETAGSGSDAFTSSSVTVITDEFGSTFGASNTEFAFAAISGTLPVELISFTSSHHNGNVTLDWVTASELNNDRFEIEQSIDGSIFRTIGEVKGAGTINEEQQYSFIHATPAFGINYYRLKQVDFDGVFEYSPVLRVNTDQLTSQLQVLQNPTRDHRLRFIYNGATNPTIRIFDASGVEYGIENMDTQISTYELDLSPLPTGSYILSVDGSFERFVVK